MHKEIYHGFILTIILLGLSCCSLVRLDGITKPPPEAVKALNTVLEILEQDGWQDKMMINEPTMYDCGSSWTILFPYPEGFPKPHLTVIVDKTTMEIKRIKR